jgi:dienelactone hydrolase
VLRPRVALLLVAALAGCGSSGKASAPTTTATPTRHDDVFAYDPSAPLDYVDRGRVNARDYPLAVHDVSFRSGPRTIQGYLVLPPGRARRPAVVFVHGSGGDRTELLAAAGWLAARNVVTLTLTEPSSLVKQSADTAQGLIAQAHNVSVADVLAVRRAVDMLRTLRVVDPTRIGYLGWSAGARTGTLVAAAEPRMKALVLLSAGAAPLSAYAAHVPASLRPQLRRALGPVDPIRNVADARPGTLLLEDGRKDTIVPRDALLRIAHAAPKGTTLRWYDAGHALTRRAYRDAFDWLARKLPIKGPRVRGAETA